MARIQVPAALNHAGEREEIPGPSKDGIYNTLTVISTAVNELSRAIQQMREQLNGLSSACTGNPGLPKSNNPVDHFEIFAIAMKEVQSKSSRIEQLEQENRALRDKLGDCEKAGERSEGFSRIIPVSRNENGERFVPSDAPNLNGKRSLITLHKDHRVHEDDSTIATSTIPESTHITNGEADPASNSNRRIGVDGPNVEIEEIPESSNAQVNGDDISQDDLPAMNDATLSKLPAEKPRTRQNPARRRRGLRTEQVLEQVTGNETRPTRPPLVAQNGHSKKAEDSASLRKEQATSSGDENSTKTGDRKPRGLAHTEPPIDSETFTPNIARETRLRPRRQLMKRGRGRPKAVASQQPQIEIITSRSPPSITGRPDVYNDNLNGLENREDASSANKEEDEKRRKAEIAARELLVQAAMQREEAYTL
ncbi:hypothetical protein GTR04_0222 [Trichophyton interdigitale]|uniref:Uncharacterized protein n=1 Tax=Trichophyton interdigitale TaxID=101480 RepID=A0A9P4YP81_9EURO|nr:hypothetical protein GY631_1282 [Trichophyton interdigitale]KAF3901297.1 hypothetical protein GY632_0036 [Trichophyton interdigitale]KAG8212395.1 hypothetical protein GTR04_0222 [Trichophyton interdigitale]